MATYIPNITDYIPQFQPFTPDYNFLGNVLQNAQSKYDSNYKALSKTYGTLLNSPMLREDNIKQREEYFKMIDQDIKKMSGLDLSLQQNVDAANTVFDSFYKNKNMVKDMVFTKEYQNQLQTAENYRNCIDQEKCGGKYWDTGKLALDYRADEFKKASREESMTMSPGRFTPFINVQEKAMKYTQDLLGKTGGFGITSTKLDSTGRYLVTTKNGAQLQIPLNQLLSNQYGQDPAIQEMFETQSYVNRKSFVQQNAAKFGGDENAAEDEYFNITSGYIREAQNAYKEALGIKEKSQAKSEILKEQIKRRGTTGYDDLAEDFSLSQIDTGAASQTVSQTEEVVKIADSIFDAGENRQMKRRVIDALMAKAEMNKAFRDAATTVAALTGQQTLEADPYAKSYYDFSLDMRKMQKQYDLMDRNNFNKSIYDLSKQQALEQFKKKGSAVGRDNNPLFVEGYAGTTSIKEIDELAEIKQEIGEATSVIENAGNNFVTGYANSLVSLISNPNASVNEKIIAKDALNKMYGATAKAPTTGSYGGRVGYDSSINKFVNANGELSDDPSSIISNYNPQDLYGKAMDLKKEYRSIPSHKAYFEKEGAQYEQEYTLNKKLLDVSSKVWKENNLNIKKFADVDASARAELSEIEDKIAWNSRFTKDGDIKSEQEFKKDFVKNYITFNKDKVASGETSAKMLMAEAVVMMDDKFQKTEEVYSKLYNSGNSLGGNVPLVKTVKGTTAFGFQGGGKTAGGANIFTYYTDSPGSLAMKGTLSFIDDVLSDRINDSGQIIVGKASSLEDVQNLAGTSSNAKAALEQYVSDIKAGKLIGKNAAVGKAIYSDIALGNEKMVGLTVTLPQSWLKQYKGTAKNPTWADDPSLLSKGISMYTTRDKAKNVFTESYKAKPLDIILNHQDETISFPNGGTVKILKRSNDGTFKVQGQIQYYDNGELKYENVGDVYSPDTSGEAIYYGIQNWLKEIDRANSEYLQTKNVNKIYHPKDLPEVQKTLNPTEEDRITDGDIESVFLRQVFQNMQQVQPQ